MKNIRFRTYIYWGITAILVIGVSVAFVFLMIHIDKVKHGVDILLNILRPIIYGAVLAYLLNPVYNKAGNAVSRALGKKNMGEKQVRTISKLCATIVSLAVLFAIVAGLISMLVPQLISSVTGLIQTLPSMLYNLEIRIAALFAGDQGSSQAVVEVYNQLSMYIEEWVSTRLTPNLDKIISNVSSGLWSGVVVNVSTKLWSMVIILKDALIGIIVMVYLLNIKQTFEAQGKKIIYGVFPLAIANKVIGEIRFIHHVFGGFIIGKIVDSIIIGILCFIGVSLMNMPYPLLISVIVGVTNVIPFFGPFIGAIPTGFLVLLVDPIKCIYFLLFILLLQQFDGNILGPKILGDSTGLQSFWVLFSILLFGGLFGFVGMIIGVPTFAVFYRMVKEGVESSLKKKDLSSYTDDYRGLNYIDEEKKTFMKD